MTQILDFDAIFYNGNILVGGIEFGDAGDVTGVHDAVDVGASGYDCCLLELTLDLSGVCIASAIGVAVIIRVNDSSGAGT